MNANQQPDQESPNRGRREALLGSLVLLLARKTMEELERIYGHVTGLPLSKLEHAYPSGASKPNAEGISILPARKASPAYSFCWTGRDWEVVFGGGKPFYPEDSLAAKATNHLLHHPNDPIQALDLEGEVQPEKAQARARDSIQPESDERALRQYRRELSRLEAEQKKARASGAAEAAARLEQDIQALRAALGGGSAPDAGERAYDNLRKSFGLMLERLSRGGPEERAFAEHLRTHVSVGYECLYSQPEGRIWG